MSKKSDILKELEKIPAHEELFLLRAQDVIAPFAIQDWIERAAHRGVNSQKLSEAHRCADRMREHKGRRLPD
jgi:hypothetical protein